jgi:hypothetical protein
MCRGESWTAYDIDALLGYRYTIALAAGPAGTVLRLYVGTGTNCFWQRGVYPGVFMPLALKNQ